MFIISNDSYGHKEFETLEEAQMELEYQADDICRGIMTDGDFDRQKDISIDVEENDGVFEAVEVVEFYREYRCVCEDSQPSLYLNEDGVITEDEDEAAVFSSEREADEFIEETESKYAEEDGRYDSSCWRVRNKRCWKLK